MGLVFREDVETTQVSKKKETRRLTSLNVKFLRSLGFTVITQNAPF